VQDAFVGKIFLKIKYLYIYLAFKTYSKFSNLIIKRGDTS